MNSSAGLVDLARERGPLIVSVVIAAAIGVQAAVLLSDAFGARDSSVAASAPDSPPPRAAPLDVGAIVNAHLFGSSAPSAMDPSAAPQTSMPMVLAGVLAEADPQAGAAIIGDTAATAKFYIVGNSLPGGARLQAVYADRVIIDRNGTLESLVLPRQSVGGRAAPPIVSNNSPGAATLERMRSMIQQNPGALSDVIRPQQVMVQGKQRGFRVYPGRNPAAFARLGLRPGDLITEINGTPLDDPARGDEIFRTIGSTPEVRVSVTRNGRQNDMVLNMSQIANEAEQMMAPNGAPSVDTNPQMPAPSGED